MRKLIPLQRLLFEIVEKMELKGPTSVILKPTVFEENNGYIATSNAVNMTPRTKHIGLKYHFFNSHIGAEKGILLDKIDTLLQKADIFTKCMAPEKFAAMRKLMCGWYIVRVM